MSFLRLNRKPQPKNNDDAGDPNERALVMASHLDASSSNVSDPTTTPSASLPTPDSYPLGAKVWHDNPTAIVDIVFIHGLSGGREKTWTAPTHTEPWPKTLLPTRLKEARILGYGYDACVVRSSVASGNRLNDHATNFLRDISNERAIAGAEGRPIILVAHSLGGLVCKAAILESRNNPEKHLCDFFNSCKGIVFMGTPHKGSFMAEWANLPARTLGIFKSVNTMLLDILETKSEALELLRKGFTHMLREQLKAGRSIETHCFFEELPSRALES